ncbi:MAG: SGNH/GDSL hydrolase family protein [Anaerolineales bacterium]|nr:SGNH/GDSL hydrolase family protein [Anaerolineales bacterium]
MQRPSIGKFSFLLIAVCAAAALLVLTVVLYAKGRGYYEELTRVRLDPLGLNSGLILDSECAVKPTEHTVVFIGDSRASSWFRSFHGSQTLYCNEGIDGQTSAQVLLRLDHGRISRAGQIVVLQIGINDLKAIPIFPDQAEVIVANLEKNISAIVDLLVEDGATVIVTTVFPVGKIPIERIPFWSSDVADAIINVNGHIRSLSSQQVIVLDANAILVDRGAEEGVFIDELHINEAGYRALNQELLPLLRGRWEIETDLSKG